MSAAAALPWAVPAALYLWAARRVVAPPPPPVQAAFCAGCLAGAVGAGLGDEPLARHMLAHGIVIGLAAPLLVAGRPVAVVARLLGPAGRQRLARRLERAPVRWLWIPAVAWTTFVVTQWAFHLTPLFAAARTETWLHEVEHALFLVTALLFWLPVFGGVPGAPRLRGAARSGYLLLGGACGDLVGAIFVGTGRPQAGAAMLASMIPFGAAFVVATAAWILGEERTERAHERHRDERSSPAPMRAPVGVATGARHG